MPRYEVNLTAIGPCWITLEADTPEEAAAAAREVGYTFLDRDDSCYELVVDSVVLERLEGEPLEPAPSELEAAG